MLSIEVGTVDIHCGILWAGGGGGWGWALRETLQGFPQTRGAEARGEENRV